MIKNDEIPQQKLKRRLPGKITAYASILVLACALVYFFLPVGYLNEFLRDRITSAFEKAYPAYTIRMGKVHYTIAESRLECDSVQILKTDSSVCFCVHQLSVSGVERLQLLWGGGVTPERLVSTHAEAKDMTLIFRKTHNEIRFALLQLSVSDSSLLIQQIEFKPTVNDERYLAGSQYLKTRYNLIVPQCNVTGLDWIDLLEEKSYHARAIQLYGPSLSVLVSEDKPGVPGASSPRMPNQFLTSIKEPLHIDSVRIMNGRLSYSERHHADMKPAILWWDSLQVAAHGISNSADPGDSAIILAQGIFMNTSPLHIRIAMPLGSPALSFRFSGMLRDMNLTKLNSFLVTAEHKRFKTGFLTRSTFAIDVTKGKASGIVRATYKDLSIAIVADRTGSESGLLKTIFSFFANNVRLRTTNTPDKYGPMKIGKVNYIRQPGETFLQFAWFSLRSGLKDIVGF